MKEHSKIVNEYYLLHNTDELRKLILENPDLPIVVLAGEDANIGDCSYMYCSCVHCAIDEILTCETPYNPDIVETDRDNFDEQMTDYLWDALGGNDVGVVLDEEEFDKKLKEEKDKYEPYWKKVISIMVDN